jgi:hypothetical protein
VSSACDWQPRMCLRPRQSAVVGYQGDSAQRQAPEPAVAGTSRLGLEKGRIKGGDESSAALLVVPSGSALAANSALCVRSPRAMAQTGQAKIGETSPRDAGCVASVRHEP